MPQLSPRAQFRIIQWRALIDAAMIPDINVSETARSHGNSLSLLIWACSYQRVVFAHSEISKPLAGLPCAHAVSCQIAILPLHLEPEIDFQTSPQVIKRCPAPLSSSWQRR